ncbi:hypothetical protein NEOLEDRAFT_6598 [Neolentinus lepideus HHB14362 ss-1]|uniref:Uncharacterized protein n=1 Tax=Neolentinus lepideus HHB14362 ss-1 TaxID=1314782 RepID=A0A165VYR1_9AGAM|nr:hypothetical protein NEOLEDRAFT_6598 [Neolentinus lepideus HHB14362 ss-1]
MKGSSVSVSQNFISIQCFICFFFATFFSYKTHYFAILERKDFWTGKYWRFRVLPELT